MFGPFVVFDDVRFNGELFVICVMPLFSLLVFTNIVADVVHQEVAKSCCRSVKVAVLILDFCGQG